MASARRVDPVTSTLTNMIMAWRHSVGVDRPIASQGLVEMAGGVDPDGSFTHCDLRDAVFAVAFDNRGGIDVRRFGKWLSEYENRVIDFRKITRSDAQTSAVRWMIVEVQGVVSRVRISFRQEECRKVSDDDTCICDTYVGCSYGKLIYFH